MDDARLSLYTAEHYLGDAFSAGHQVASFDVEQAVQSIVTNEAIRLAILPILAHEVYARCAPQIARYGLPVVRTPITSEAAFVALATTGGLYTISQGNDPFVGGLRRYVHEELDHVGVEVTSRAHPQPWILTGDHDLESPAAKTSLETLQAALADAREVFEVNAKLPAENADELARQLFDKHRPTPTDDSKQVVQQILGSTAVSKMAFVTALAESMAGAIEATLDSAVGMGILVRLVEPDAPAPGIPELPRHDGGAGGGAETGEGDVQIDDPQAWGPGTSLPGGEVHAN
jgi:hypothetical protein